MRFSKHNLKVWLRSGSFEFMKNSELRALAGNFPVRSYAWRGKPIFYRAHSSDAVNIYKILLNRGRKGEYHLPAGLQPDTILDVGANIGIASIYLAARYPAARIYAFEPIPENFELLKRNIEGYGNIEAHPVALGTEDGELLIHYPSGSHNLGSFSAYGLEVDAAKGIQVAQRNINSILREIGLGKIDLIKIDTEGGEDDILRSLDRERLRLVDWITGELHGIRDFELLAYLSEFFDLELKKSLRKRRFMFNACNRRISPSLRN